MKIYKDIKINYIVYFPMGAYRIPVLSNFYRVPLPFRVENQATVKSTNTVSKTATAQTQVSTVIAMEMPRIKQPNNGRK